MLQAIGGTLTYAIGIMVSPLPVIALLVMLMGKRARADGLVFSLGWMISVLILIYIALRLGTQYQQSQPSRGDGITQIVFGTLFILFALSQLRVAYKTRHNPTLPKWMDKLGSMNLLVVFGLAFLLNLSNVKNIPLAAQAVTVARGFNLSGSEAWIVAIIFALITTIPFLVPTIWVIVGGERATREMSHAKDFLQKYNHLMMGILFLFMGAQGFGGGLQILAKVGTQTVN